MPQNSEQKIKLLILYELLKENTDEDNPMTTQEIVSALKDRGITVSRKTLYNDIDILNEYGFDVVCDRQRSNKYFVGERKFERPEVQMLLSAVGAANFLSDKKTKMLLYKLSELLGPQQAQQVIETISVSGAKHSNEVIYYSIDSIITALLSKKQLSFLYFDYGINGERIYRKERERYILNPLGMVFSDNNLYFVGFHEKYETPTNYRVDRMDEVKVEEKTVADVKQYKNFDLNTYTKSQFEMYGGKQVDVSLIFPKDLLGIAIDRFGENIKPIITDNDEYIVNVSVQVSKMFFAWLTTFEGRVMIKSPLTVTNQYKTFIKNIAESL